jgi:hypothetical protein
MKLSSSTAPAWPPAAIKNILTIQISLVIMQQFCSSSVQQIIWKRSHLLLPLTIEIEKITHNQTTVQYIQNLKIYTKP